MKKRILCLVTDGFEEIEMVTPVDLLHRAGAEVVVVSVTGDLVVTGRSELKLTAQRLLADENPADWDLLFIPGGPGVRHLRKDGRAAQLAKNFEEAGKPVAAICAAPLVLADAGLLEGRKFTAHFSAYEELPGASHEERVVEDGNLITSRGAGTALEFGLALVRRLYGNEEVEDLSEAIML